MHDEEDLVPPPARRRKLLLAAFWFVFLTTPIFAVLSTWLSVKFSLLYFLDPIKQILISFGGTLVSGGMVSGIIYARLVSESNDDFLLRAFRCGCFLSLVYFVIIIFILAFGNFFSR